MIHTPKFLRILIFCGITGATSLFGQGSFDLDEIRVVAPYEPTISDAHKIALTPSIGEIPDIQLSFNYVIPARLLTTRFDLEPIAPARMRGEPLTKLYRGLVKGGYGNYSTPYFEGFYNSLRSNNRALGVHLKHMSSGGGIDSTGHSGYSNNLINLSGSKFFSGGTLNAGMTYERNALHYYGFNQAHFAGNDALFAYIDTLPRADIRQTFNRMGANVGFGNNRADSSFFNHQSSVSYQYFADAYDATEHQFNLNAYVGRNISADPFGMADKQHFSMKLEAGYYNVVNQLDTNNTSLISLQPRIWSKYDAFRFYIGLNASFQIDTTSFFRAYPLIGAEFHLSENRFVAFASVSGKTEKHAVSNLSRENPFIRTSLPQGFMNVRSDIGGGIKGKAGDLISYMLSVNRAAIDNYPFFVNDTIMPLNNTFSVVYDNITRFHLHAEIMSQFGERFSARLTGNYFQHNPENETEAWHTPKTLFSAHLRYNIQNKIILNANIFSRGETYGRSYEQPGLDDLPLAFPTNKAYLDINVGVEYRYTKLLSVFLNFNNVSNEPAKRWMNYPTQGFNFLGGLAFSF